MEKKSDIKKVIRDGKVAVLYSPGFGAGWYTWNTEHPELLFHPELVKMVEEGKQAEITASLCEQLLGVEDYICDSGAGQLTIQWLPVGTAFKVDEYDGSESIETMDDLVLVA
jgi:hypothetical protein